MITIISKVTIDGQTKYAVKVTSPCTRDEFTMFSRKVVPSDPIVNYGQIDGNGFVKLGGEHWFSDKETAQNVADAIHREGLVRPHHIGSWDY